MVAILSETTLVLELTLPITRRAVTRLLAALPCTVIFRWDARSAAAEAHFITAQIWVYNNWSAYHELS